MQSDYASYMPGFGNDFETEALTGALPKDKTLHKNVHMVYMQSNYQAHHLPLHEEKTREVGVIESDLLLST